MLVAGQMERVNACIGDRLILLFLSDIGSQEGWLGITKLQKLSFLCEYALSEKGFRALGYEFYMYDLGPMSREVYDGFEYLLEEELLIEDERGIRTTALGHQLSKEIEEQIPKNIKATIRNIAMTVMPKKTDQLVSEVHKMKVKLPDGTQTVVDEIPKREVILPKQISTCVEYVEQYKETIEIITDKNLLNSIKSARKSKSKSEPYKPLASSS
jgi:uncharacterized protein YwgA